ncbi:AraC family transcriptional regulator [Paenibacillus ginsengarvi]|uniref:AraC family transcriptional regulator n=1 Tax=Paenibacillus ginsengarvi TaxID=400777 RepID=UPI001EFFEF98|nr:AraC family transcriptional regulator [Paenibacillus ginsengarvi]
MPTPLPRLPLRTNLHLPPGDDIPFHVYTVGTEQQAAITRLKGFSANQLFLTFSGGGLFRPLGRDKWDIVEANTLLYIPAGVPHEYVPQGTEPWLVGYVTFVETHGMLEGWGFGREPYRLRLESMEKLLELIADVWSASGPQYDAWRCAELLFTFCAELKKQRIGERGAENEEAAAKTARYRDSATGSAVRFLHDHLHRKLTMTELASYAGYSAKQLNRLFRRELGLTPMQYLQRIRLKTASLLLVEQPNLTVRQIAAHIGMEPDYLARLYRRVYGKTPAEARRR